MIFLKATFLHIHCEKVLRKISTFLIIWLFSHCCWLQVNLINLIQADCDKIIYTSIRRIQFDYTFVRIFCDYSVIFNSDFRYKRSLTYFVRERAQELFPFTNPIIRYIAIPWPHWRAVFPQKRIKIKRHIVCNENFFLLLHCMCIHTVATVPFFFSLQFFSSILCYSVTTVTHMMKSNSQINVFIETMLSPKPLIFVDIRKSIPKSVMQLNHLNFPFIRLNDFCWRKNGK